MRAALDTDILACAEGVNGRERRNQALDLLRRLPLGTGILPVQVLGELFNVLVRKSGRSRLEARDALLAWQDAFAAVDTSPAGVTTAAGLSCDHDLGIWDAVILSAASHAGCRVLLSEDLQDGFTWGGVTVVNPFADPAHPLLEAVLAG